MPLNAPLREAISSRFANANELMASSHDEPRSGGGCFRVSFSALWERESPFLMPRLCSFLGMIMVFLFAGPLHAAEWETKSGYRLATLDVRESERIGFTQMKPATTGINFTNVLSRSRYMTNQIYLNGSGVTAGDVDGDGKVDVFFAGLDGKNRLFRNLGNWRFEDVTDQAGVGAPGVASSGCAFADIDGDRDLDLLVNSVGQGTHLFTNDGRGKFIWQTRRRAPNAGKGGMSMALADVDGDGDLDLYLTNYRTWTYRDRPRPKIKGNVINGKPTVVSFDGRPTTEPDLVGRFSLTEQHKIIENGELDAFFLNDGKGRFKQVTFNGGTFLTEGGAVWQEQPFDWGLSVMFRDMNGDRAPDLYVCNDFSAPDRVWINDGKGKFRFMPALSLRNTSRFSMGIDFADLDRDGHDDFVVMDMLSRSHERRMLQMGDPPLSREIGDDLNRRPQFSRNTMYRNRGDGTYAEVGYWAGTHAAEWAWTPAFVDVDLDGFEDLLVTNGHERDALDADVRQQIEREIQNPRLSRNDILLLSSMYARLATPNVAFRNKGDFSFEDVSEAWGFDTPEVSHGMALADLDGDGDQDVLVNNLNGLAGVFKNEGAAPRVAVRLRGVAPNTVGVGAKIRFIGQPQNQSQEIVVGGRYLSSDDSLRAFACDATEENAVIEVTWRSGAVSRIEGVRANRIYEIDEAGAQASSGQSQPKSPSAPLFEDQTKLLNHLHRETAFDDFFRQRTLARGLSELGPGVAWADLDADGYEDLLIGSGRGGQMAVLTNLEGKRFKSLSSGRLNPVQIRDQTGIVSWRTESAGVRIASGWSNYEDGSVSGVGVSIANFDQKAKPATLPATKSSAGPLALCDFDGDGDLDLFVGGRMIPGQYPKAASSQLWINEEGELKPSPLNSSLFKDLGLVSGAVWTDLDADGFAELVLATDWGSIRVFTNKKGELSDGTTSRGLADATGWWNGVTSGDFNGDGRMDLIASNWGHNHAYQPIGAENLEWFSGQPTPGGPTLVVEGYTDATHDEPVPLRGLSLFAASLPGAREKYRTYQQFSKASVESMLGARMGAFESHKVATFSHTLFLNRESGFEPVPLPWSSQLAPAFAVAVADVDLDGNEDVFLSQNFFYVRPEMSRLDAGRGLLMRGDGRGGFEPVDGSESGINVYGEQRGAAFGDYDRDGRVDLVVTQNGAKTRLFRNQGSSRGLRLHVTAGSDNLTGVGVVIQVGEEGQWGAAREIHGGSGYWSQDSPVQIVPSAVKKIRARWPGGRTTVATIPEGAEEIWLAPEGVTKSMP